jgi:FMN hydrolase / 5-amino-6-(5-phospho-D-ribitylamino)uracil phosphatase
MADGAIQPGERRTVIKAVTFDFWNTIARVPTGAMNEARRRAIALACEELEVEMEAAALERALEEVGQTWERAWAEGRHLHPSQGAEALARVLGVGEDAEAAVAEAFLAAGREVGLQLAPDIRPVLQALGERGIRLGIVCDVGFSGGELLRELLDGEGLLQHFSGWAFSDEVGHYKPSPRIFEAALEALGAQPGEAMHVGDLRRTDVAGAAALGMRTARYRGIHDDADLESGVEAEFVLDTHRDLLRAIE